MTPAYAHSVAKAIAATSGWPTRVSTVTARQTSRLTGIRRKGRRSSSRSKASEPRSTTCITSPVFLVVWKRCDSPSRWPITRSMSRRRAAWWTPTKRKRRSASAEPCAHLRPAYSSTKRVAAAVFADTSSGAPSASTAPLNASGTAAFISESQSTSTHTPTNRTCRRRSSGHVSAASRRSTGSACGGGGFAGGCARPSSAAAATAIARAGVTGFTRTGCELNEARTARTATATIATAAVDFLAPATSGAIDLVELALPTPRRSRRARGAVELAVRRLHELRRRPDAAACPRAPHRRPAVRTAFVISTLIPTQWKVFIVSIALTKAVSDSSPFESGSKMSK